MNKGWLLLACLAAACGNSDGGVCGDGFRETTESCDDGNLIDGDGCSAACAIEIPEGCGDGVVAGDEQCDGGGAIATCDIDCTAVACGDAQRNSAAGEGCDDGNSVDGDGCSSDCHIEIPGACGNSAVDEGETCDDGDDSESCDGDCTAVECGDAYVNEVAGEGCDDGSESADCDADCTAVECGDGHVNAAAGEACDGGPDCTGECQPVAIQCGLPGVGCGMSEMGTTDMAGGTDVHDSYSCLVDFDASGVEQIYEWIADDTDVSVFLEGNSSMRVVVLEAGADCTPTACVASGIAGTNFTAVIGQRYLIVVDTLPATSAPYLVGLFCGG